MVSSYITHNLRSFWRLIRETFFIYTRIGGEQSAASFAYYALFSLVPLVALLLTLGSHFFPNDSVMAIIYRFVPGVDQQQLLCNMAIGLEKARGSVSIISVVILTWASLRFFQALVLSINHAWGTRRLPWWQMSIKNLIMILAMSGSLFLGMVLLAVLQGLARVLHSLEALITLHFPLLNVRHLLNVVDFSRYVGGTLVLFYSIIILYMLAPRHKTTFSQIWIPALLVSILLQVGQAFFVNIVPKLINYNAIYGAMGGMMFLLLWVYVAGVIIIGGGCLCSAMAHLRGSTRIREEVASSQSSNLVQIPDHPNP